MACARSSPRAVGPTIERRGAGATAVIYGYWPGSRHRRVPVDLPPDACAGLIPTNDGQTCVFAARHPGALGRGGMDVLDDIVAAASPDLAARLATPPRPTAYGRFGGMPGYIRLPWGPGWALVGDAAYWKDPLGAHGLTDALRDAEILARAIIAVANGDVAEPMRSTTTTGPATACRSRCSTSSTRSPPCAGPTPRSRTASPAHSTMSDEVEFVARFDDEPAVSGAPL